MSTAPAEQRLVAEAPLWRTLIWAGFLASSWTWVIGMFFPTLLIRDFGVLGWLAFAIPNVLGASLFAWWITSASMSLRVVGIHRRAAMGFSDVTIMFHAYVATCLIPPLLGWAWSLAAVVLGLLVWAFAAGSIRLAAVLGLVMVMVSAWVVATFLQQGYPVVTPLEVRPLKPHFVAMGWLVPVMFGGFMLCPYLDLTFHRARQNNADSGGRLAFAVGFGVFFLVMILLSMLYASFIAGVFTAQGFGGLPRTGIVLLGVHFVGQMAYTVGLHLNEVTRQRGAHGLFRIVVFSIVAAVAGIWVYGSQDGHEGERIEMGYRFFLLAYGLLFPAYVLICMVPTRRDVELRMAWRVCLATVLVASPFGYLGFVDGRYPWMCLVSLGLIVVGRLALSVVPRRVG